MILSTSSKTAQIDAYCDSELGISLRGLMERAGRAVADAVRARVPRGSRISILAGKGNNGADGYAAALILHGEYDVTVFDVFSLGQRTEDGIYFMESLEKAGGTVKGLDLDGGDAGWIRSSACVIDAIFGTGFRGEIPESICRLSEIVSGLVGAEKIAIDVPIGVNADDGSVDMSAVCAMTATVALGFVKPGLVSYPAKAYIGTLIYDDLGLPADELTERFEFSHFYIDDLIALSGLPPRPENSNKGSFGRLLSITGSEKYRGAAYLSLEASLRGGVGLVTHLGERAVGTALCARFPEVIYREMPSPGELTDDDLESIAALSLSHSATLIGSGSGHTEGLRRLVTGLLGCEGSPLVLDADALNVLSDDPQGALQLLKNAKRRLILTPHPLELSRLSGIPVSDIQLHRISVAECFARECGCILVLKGAATVVTDGSSLYVNSSGSSALAKAGSGDVLAGFLASLIASGADPLLGAVSAVYFHGRAADRLSASFSELGVTPSDLPREIAVAVASLLARD